MEVSNHIAKYIEFNLYHYYDMKGEIDKYEIERENIIDGNVYVECPDNRRYGSVVESKALKLVCLEEETGREMQDKILRVKAIEGVMGVLNKFDRDFIRLKYFDGKSEFQIAERLKCNRKTLWRHRQTILEKLAVRMNLV
jgi:DNA-directed RNA polymerase specialized sigma subunit